MNNTGIRNEPYFTVKKPNTGVRGVLKAPMHSKYLFDHYSSTYPPFIYILIPIPYQEG